MNGSAEPGDDVFNGARPRSNGKRQSTRAVGTPLPRATYRLQFRREFGFAAAAALAPYLRRLGVSHVYASPYLKARPGTTHGYDIIDHRRLNPELGDAADFHAMVAAFRAHDLRQILDFVPNHMGVGGDGNQWWQDVLEWGADSEYAGWFDIDWEPDSRFLHGKVLVPLLGDQYGAVLESGQLRLRFDDDAGSFAVWAYDTHKLPISPLHYERILGSDHPRLEQIGDAFAGLPAWHPRVARRAEDLQAELAAEARDNTEVRGAVEAAVARLNGEPGCLESWRELNALIQDQHWRVAHFRVAADDINYRRFFNINELAGLRMELPELFHYAHELVFDLLGDGTLDGLRIDHVDGLFDPKSYLSRLREYAPRPFYLVVEKILGSHEAPRDDWPIDGTTGYEFANLVLGLLMDPAGEPELTRFYADFTGNEQSFAETVRDCKIRIMTNEMASELNVLARGAARVARQNPRTADFTRNILQRALREIIACFPVYRTYVDETGSIPDTDRRDLDWALAQARRNETDVDPSVFDFLYQALSADLVARPRSGFSRHSVIRFAMRVQQYSGPVMAKGLEDTAFYRYNRFVALNEVGGHPDRFGVSIGAFHAANAQRAARWPHAMLATSTHDTKRGEDVRARLAVLSEMPEEWTRQVQLWSRLLRARRGDVEAIGPPDRNDEYLFYQLLLGAWPAELTRVEALDAAALAAFAERIEGAMIKSVREAKTRSSWTAPNAGYEQALLAFVRAALDVSRPNAFLDSFLPFQGHVATLGVANSLAQTTLKLTVPGMPDIYQGTELWDLSLVDPDNRRPVDYRGRDRLLTEIAAVSEPGVMAAMMRDWRDGRIKLGVTARLLALRNECPTLFSDGGYEPLSVSGRKADHVCAFARTAETETIAVIVARFPAGRAVDPVWADTEVQLPTGGWRELFTGAIFRSPVVPVGDLLPVLPVAVLVRHAKR